MFVFKEYKKMELMLDDNHEALTASNGFYSYLGEKKNVEPSSAFFTLYIFILEI